MNMPVDNPQCGDRHRGWLKPTRVGKQPEHLWRLNTSDTSAQVTALWVDDLLRELALNPPEDLSAVRSRQRGKAIALLRDEALVEAAYSFNKVHLQGVFERNQLLLDGETLPIRTRLPKKGELTALACGVCTLGPRLEVRVRQLFAEKRTAIALALDSLGNELLQALYRQMQIDLLDDVHREGLTLGHPLQIGDSEHDLPAQAAILRLAGASSIGVNLHHGQLPWPRKSTVVVLAVGRKLPKTIL
jgi:hypothetical protein